MCPLSPTVMKRDNGTERSVSMTASVWGQDAFTQWCVGEIFFSFFFLRQTCNRICYMGLGVRFFILFYLSWLISFSMWFELLACRLLWVINTNECVLFIFKFMFWDVQAPCNRCLFIFIINNKSKDSLLFNRWYPLCFPLFNIFRPQRNLRAIVLGIISKCCRIRRLNTR